MLWHARVRLSRCPRAAAATGTNIKQTTMKLFILVCVIAAATMQDYDVKFFEKTGYFVQKVKIDKQKDTVEFDVPKHGNVEGAKYLNDYQKRLVVMKLDSAKLCYAWDMPRDESKPIEIEAGLKHFQGKFPNDKYMVVNENMLPLHYLNSSSLTQEVKDFCGSYPVIKAALFKDKAAMEAGAIQEVKSQMSGRRKKRALTVTTFSSCTQDSSKYIDQCGRSGTDLKVTCKFVVSNTCVYQMACGFSSAGWQCPAPKHMFTYLHCCDYFC